MRARLLDMGEVSAVRSQSIYHAVAATMGPEDSPVAILLRPASSLVSIGIDSDPATEVDLGFCLENRIPVLRRGLDGPAELIGNSQLLFDFLVHEKRPAEVRLPTPEPLAKACRTLGLPAVLGPAGQVLVGDEDNPSRQVGSSRTGILDRAFCMIASLARDPEPVERGSVLLRHRDAATDAATEDYPASSLAEELSDRPDFATVAEALIVAVEESFEVELVPSMPTPDEMDAIYEWDERLVIDLELAVGVASRRIAIN